LKTEEKTERQCGQ